MMRILGTGLPVPLWRRAFRKELRDEGARAPKAETPKPSRNAESETKAKTKRLEKVERKRSRPNAADEPPRLTLDDPLLGQNPANLDRRIERQRAAHDEGDGADGYES